MVMDKDIILDKDVTVTFKAVIQATKHGIQLGAVDGLGGGQIETGGQTITNNTVHTRMIATPDP